jgi:hypothetical protein
MGRKTILNDQLIERLVLHTLKGISIESICALSGISPAIYCIWMKQGEQDIKEGVESIHRVFRESVLAAEAEIEQHLLDLDLPPQKLIQKIN